jgi:transglutaminase-like putative cysteine protease
MLFCFVLSMSTSSVMATNQTTTTNNTGIVDQNSSQYSTESQNSSTNIAAGSPATTQAAGTTLTVTRTQLTKAASNVKIFIDTNNRLPKYVTIANQRVTLPQFLQLLNDGILNLNTNPNATVTLKSVNAAPYPTQTVKSGSLTKSEILTIAGNLKTFINTNGRLPNYITTTLGKVRYESLIYMYSKMFVYYSTNNKLPTTVSITPWTPSTGSSTLTAYLQPTKNCQSTSTTITTLAAQITSGLTSKYDKAEAIFNWVRDNIAYTDSYYSTKYGALGVLNSKVGNCCDHSHLVIALARAVGIPGRYHHGYCQFSDGWFGHVWSELYIDGSWYYADAMSTQNMFGVVNNWNVNNFSLRGLYIELPF